MFKVVQDDGSANANGASRGNASLLDEIVRDGARQMLAAALPAEVAAYIEAHKREVDENGRRLVLRNGYHSEREVTTAAGAVAVRAPRVNDKRIDPATGKRVRFASSILPAWARKSPQVSQVLPLLYLHGLSTSDFAPALEQFLCTGNGLSAATITRLTEQWRDEARAFSNRSLAEADYMYLWVDGIHLKVRLERDKVCLLVMIGVRADGRKELVALADGFRESSESWADLLRDCRRRGMRAPVLAIGDGALGFWKAVRDVFPETCEQRCWWHKVGNVLAVLPKSAHLGAKKALAQIYNAENKAEAIKAAKAFANDYRAKWPKAAAKIGDDLDVLLAFYDYRLSTGCICAPLTRSSQLSRPFGYGPASPKARAHEPPGSPWRSNLSNPPKHAGARSTLDTWSPSSAPEPNSRTENSSNDPTDQEVTLKPPNTPIHGILTIARWGVTAVSA